MQSKIFQQQFEPWKIWIGVTGGSVLFHIISYSVLQRSQPVELVPKPRIVRLQVIEERVEAVSEAKPKEPPPRRQPKPQQPASERQPPKTLAQTPPPPVFGVDKNSVVKEGEGQMLVPVGNTLMMADDGRRVKDPLPLASDLSSDALLIRDSLPTPQYTDAALDANLEGYVMVDVYVDAVGKVVAAELRKKVGYGMDDRILDAVHGSRFVPRKNRLGGAEAAWTELKFNLQLP